MTDPSREALRPFNYDNVGLYAMLGVVCVSAIRTATQKINTRFTSSNALTDQPLSIPPPRTEIALALDGATYDGFVSMDAMRWSPDLVEERGGQL